MVELITTACQYNRGGTEKIESNIQLICVKLNFVKMRTENKLETDRTVNSNATFVKLVNNVTRYTSMRI